MGVGAGPRPGDQVVEVGSFQGRSTIVFASAAPAGATVTAIDPHAGNDRGPQEISGMEVEAESDSQTFQRNLAEAGVADRVTYLRRWSQDALADHPGPVTCSTSTARTATARPVTTSADGASGSRPAAPC